MDRSRPLDGGTTVYRLDIDSEAVDLLYDGVNVEVLSTWAWLETGFRLHKTATAEFDKVAIALSFALPVEEDVCLRRFGFRLL